jgi:hypothetical protein
MLPLPIALDRNSRFSPTQRPLLPRETHGGGTKPVLKRRMKRSQILLERTSSIGIRLCSHRRICRLRTAWSARQRRTSSSPSTCLRQSPINPVYCNPVLAAKTSRLVAFWLPHSDRHPQPVHKATPRLRPMQLLGKRSFYDFQVSHASMERYLSKPEGPPMEAVPL